MIIHDIHTTRTSAIEFLHRSKQHWHARQRMTRSYINKSNVHWRIGGRWSCGSIGSAKGHKGGKHCWGKNKAIHRNASGNIIIHRGAGDDKVQWRAMEIKEVWVKNCNEEKTCFMDKATLLEKGIKILNPERFIWT
jgi:hypothetical protein